MKLLALCSAAPDLFFPIGRSAAATAQHATVRHATGETACASAIQVVSFDKRSTDSSCSMDMPTSESMLLSLRSCVSSPTGCRRSLLPSVSRWYTSSADCTDGFSPCTQNGCCQLIDCSHVVHGKPKPVVTSAADCLDTCPTAQTMTIGSCQ